MGGRLSWTALLAGGIVSFASVPRSAEAAGPIRVVNATTELAYVDAGRQDGLRNGQKLHFAKGKTCKIEALGDDWASCKGDALIPGSRAQEGRKAPKGPRIPDPSRLGVSMRQLRQAYADMDKSMPGIVASPAGSSRSWVRTSVGTRSWMQFDDARSTQAFQASLQIMDKQLGDLPLWLNADADFLFFTEREAAPRHNPDTDAQAYLWELNVEYRGDDYKASVGRLGPDGMPGLIALDGFRIERQLESALLDSAGLYGGLLPRFGELEFDSARWTAGVFALTEEQSSDDKRSWYAGMRAGVQSIGDLQNQGESLGLSTLFAPIFGLDLGKVGILSQSLFRSEPGELANIGVSHGSLSVSSRPGNLILEGGGTYSNRGDDVWTGLLSSDFGYGPRVRGDAKLGYVLTAPFDVSMTGGAITYLDQESEVQRAFAGPEVNWRSGRFGVFGLRYAEELGWISGRNARLSWTAPSSLLFGLHQSITVAKQALNEVQVQDPMTEIYGITRATYRIRDGLWAALSALVRHGQGDPVFGDTVRPYQTGFNGSLDLQGSF